MAKPLYLKALRQQYESLIRHQFLYGLQRYYPSPLVCSAVLVFHIYLRFRFVLQFENYLIRQTYFSLQCQTYLLVIFWLVYRHIDISAKHLKFRAT